MAFVLQTHLGRVHSFRLFGARGAETASMHEARWVGRLDLPEHAKIQPLKGDASSPSVRRPAVPSEGAPACCSTHAAAGTV